MLFRQKDFIGRHFNTCIIFNETCGCSSGQLLTKCTHRTVVVVNTEPSHTSLAPLVDFLETKFPSKCMTLLSNNDVLACSIYYTLTHFLEAVFPITDI